jgi:hypothetical protein
MKGNVSFDAPGRPLDQADIDGDDNTERIWETIPEKAARHRLITGQALQTWKTHKEFLQDERWRPLEYKGGKTDIQCFSMDPQPASGFSGCKPMEGDTSKVYAMKAQALIHGKTARELGRVHRDANRISRLVWDKDVSDIELLETIREDEATGNLLTVQRAVLSPPPGLSLVVSKRDLVFFQFSTIGKSRANPQDEECTLLARHTEHPARPIGYEKCVRAQSMSVIRLTPMPPVKKEDDLFEPVTEITVAGWLQLGGAIPDEVVGLYRTALADRIDFLRGLPHFQAKFTSK